jgi:hypothetical protein
MDGIKLLEHLGNGYNGTVFLAEHEGEEVALKLQYGRLTDKEKSFDRGVREYEVHCALEGVEGIAKPIEFRDYIEGDFESLGLWRLGLNVGDVTMSYGYDAFFNGAFLFEYMGELRDVSEGVSEYYFAELREILSKVNNRGYDFPRDADFLVRQDQPVILDFSSTPMLKDYGGHAVKRMILRNRERIDNLESKFLADAA